MAAHRSLSKSRHAEVGLDQQQLYAIGLDHIRQLARNIWTDHNVHDPGITAMELASFALTDLTYRANLPIEDLLSGSTFVTAGTILPNQPLTRLDYRKLIIDVDGVKNAWVNPVELPCFADTATGEIHRVRPSGAGIREVRIRGLYEISIEYTDDTTTDAAKQAVDTAVLLQVHRHRNLCEDFTGVKRVDVQQFLLCGEIELSPEADTAWVHAEVLRQVQHYLAPGVGRYTLSQMLDRRKPDGTPNTVPDVFDGPRLIHGFIDSAELEAADLRKEVRLSDIISIVMDIAGVVAVRDLIIGPEQPKATVTSVTRAGTTATVTMSAPHGFKTGQRITIAGANQADYNGAFDITVTRPTTFTFTVAGAPATPATGTITARGPGVPLDNRWIVAVDAGKEPTLNAARSRLIYYKRNIPIHPEALKAVPLLKPRVIGRVAVASIIRSSTTATVTTGAPHGFTTGQRVTIAGAKQGNYNGAFDITVSSPTTFTFKVTGSPATPATGTMTATGPPEDITVPRGRARNVKDYYSFQHHFPAVYGVGDSPIAPSEGLRRIVLASQLKGYLLFFDQVMANYCAQLSDVAKLFSIDPSITATYFSQLAAHRPVPQNAKQDPDYLVDNKWVLETYGVDVAGANALADAHALAAKVGALIETDGERINRRKRFLDHLISRFAERFHDFALIMSSAFGATDASLIADKCAFLNEYPTISADRALAYDYTLQAPEDSWGSFNVAGLEKRLARLLGIGNSRRRDLTDVTIGADATVTGNPANKFGFTLKHAETGIVLLTEGAKLATADLTTKQMLRAFELGQWNSTYLRAPQKANQRWFFDIVAKDGEVVAQSQDFLTEADRETAIVELRTYLRQRYSREGFYIIENLLLRPEQNGDPTLHFCVEPDCTDCAGDDPYSYRIHVVLPAYAGRFNDMDFRRFVEEVIREEVPAHILPKICWIDEESMRGVQQAYREWLEIRSGAVSAGRAARVKALVDVLTKVKSVYPVQKLTDCAAPETEPRFILGRTALGSKNDND